MTKNKFIEKRILFIWAILCIVSFSAVAQTRTLGNVFIKSGAEASIHNVMQMFSTGGGAPLDGIVGTDRVSPRAAIGFVGTATWSTASNSAHIDGYAKSYLTGPFIFPIGDNGFYRPARVSSASAATPVDAAYYRANPSIAITSSIKGGNEVALPNGTYNVLSKAAEIFNVSTVEYWDINGAASTQISLTWDLASDINTMTGGNLSKLTIVGWDGTQWVVIPSTVDVTSVIGGASTLTAGSITTNAAIVPNTFDVYALGVRCPTKAAPAPSVNPSPICLGVLSGLSSTTSAGDTVKWYSNRELTSLVGLGNPVNTVLSVLPGVTTKYYLAFVNGACVSSIDSATVVVNNCLVDDTKITFQNVPINVGPAIVIAPAANQTLTASHGTITLNGDGTVTYSPSNNYVGLDTMVRTICVPGTPQICNTQKVTIIVAPVMTDTLIVRAMNTSVDAMGNRIVLGSGAVQSPIQGPKYGVVTTNADGTIKYVPNNNVVGLDTVNRKICVSGVCDSSLLVVKLTPNVSDISATTTVNTPVNVAGPLLAATIGSSINYSKIGGPSNGTATVNASTGQVSYTPNIGFIGRDTVKVTTCVNYTGSATACDTHLVIISIGLVTVINNDVAVGYIGQSITGDVKTNDIVEVGTKYGPAVAASTNPSAAVLTIASDGKYSLSTNVQGVYVFTISVCAPGQTSGCPTSILTITVLDPTRIDNKPILNTDYTTTKINTPVTVSVLSNDASGNVGISLNKNSLTISTAPKRGTAVINADASISYTPNTGFSGYDTIVYSVCDNATPPNCGSALVIINVTNAEVAYVNDDVASGSGILTGNTILNDKFPIGSKPRVKPQTFVLTGKGQLVIDSLGNYTWTPVSGYSGIVSFVITTCDGNTPEACYTSTLYIVASNQLVAAQVPNYISPNGDGINDVWNIDGILLKYPNAKAIVYNRWGNVVWRSTGSYGRSSTGRNIWYGQQEGSQELVPDGVYYYLLELEDGFGTTKTGFIEIMRQ